MKTFLTLLFAVVAASAVACGPDATQPASDASRTRTTGADLRYTSPAEVPAMYPGASFMQQQQPPQPQQPPPRVGDDNSAMSGMQ